MKLVDDAGHFLSVMLYLGSFSFSVEVSCRCLVSAVSAASSCMRDLQWTVTSRGTEIPERTPHSCDALQSAHQTRQKCGSVDSELRAAVPAADW